MSSGLLYLVGILVGLTPYSDFECWAAATQGLRPGLWLRVAETATRSYPRFARECRLVVEREWELMPCVSK
jgi:hypothetical protein